ncbi:type II toxin-antitoxin system RelE family toxin [Hippea alviniae]|uniref:type II toxin-antitoxin system RelE family toxin n=1 Tax=Hippea alviniae TaxID=1279027 RepID=UPI0003B6FBF6|nr:type II toxin-antitoxin system RelE/ParE family toxin [Hippea alviniae]
MSKYKIYWKKSAVKELKKLPKESIKKILLKVEKLKEDPFFPGCKRLKNTHNLYRAREGDYRIIYSVEQNTLTIQIIRIRHRKEVYKKL